MGAIRLLGPAVLKPWLPAPQAASGQPAPPPAASAPAKRVKGLTSMEDKVVLAGRSVYYGALVYAGYLTGKMWLVVALQALAVAYVLQLLMQRLWKLRTRAVIGTVAALSLLTPLGVYTGFLMPDVFAPLVILCMGTLAFYWRELPYGHRWALSLLLLFGLSAHASHGVLAASLLGLALLVRWLSSRWQGMSKTALLVVAFCIGGAVAAEWAFNKAVTMAVGAPPLRMPHPMARLIDLGPGTAYLKQHCPDADFAACAYLQNYPTRWDAFLFSTDPEKGAFALADAATKRRLSDEQLRFAMAVLRFDPVGVATGIGKDVLKQWVEFRVDITRYDHRGLALFEGRVPDAVFTDMQNSRAANESPLNAWLTMTTYALVLLSVLLLAWWHASRGKKTDAAPQQRLFTDFAWLVVAGVVANGAICATLASSLDRFQSRVIWLLPFLALAALAQARAHRPISVHIHGSAMPSAMSSVP